MVVKLPSSSPSSLRQDAQTKICEMLRICFYVKAEYEARLQTKLSLISVKIYTLTLD